MAHADVRQLNLILRIDFDLVSFKDMFIYLIRLID